MTQPNAQSRRVQRRAAHTTAFDFFNLLTAPELLEHLETRLPPHRERLFPPTETLSMFLSQVLSADGSCRQVVDQAATARVLGDLPCCSTATGAYVRARQRVPLALVRELTRITGALIRDGNAGKGSWQGRRVRVVDGTTVSLPDTPANQAAYPQQSNQNVGLGFPLSRVVAAFDLADGSVVDAAMGGYYGKGAHEQALLRQILPRFERGDVVLGDALYATYFLLAELQRRGMDAVFVQHGARQRVSASARHRLPTRQAAWGEGPSHHADQADEETGLDGCGYLRSDAGQLDRPRVESRWPHSGHHLARCHGRSQGRAACPLRAALAGRAQSSPSEDHAGHAPPALPHPLRCRTPAMAEKELWVYLLAYNLIRWVMRDSAQLADLLAQQMSFKHTLQIWQSWSTQARAGEDPEARIQRLLILVAQHRVGHRPGRIEPRAVKRRPKPYALLTVPRAQARAIVRRHGHPNRKKGEGLNSLARNSENQSLRH